MATKFRSGSPESQRKLWKIKKRKTNKEATGWLTCGIVWLCAGCRRTTDGDGVVGAVTCTHYHYHQQQHPPLASIQLVQSPPGDLQLVSEISVYYQSTTSSDHYISCVVNREKTNMNNYVWVQIPNKKNIKWITNWKKTHYSNIRGKSNINSIYTQFNHTLFPNIIYNLSNSCFKLLMLRATKL